MILFYIRHGEPVYEPDMLTGRGKQQAEALSLKLAGYGIDSIYSSSSQRAVQTARPTALRYGLPVNILDWCNEKYAYEEFTAVDGDGNKKWIYQTEWIKKQFASPEVKSLGDRWYEYEPFAGKGYGKGIERISRHTYEFIESLGYKYDFKTDTYTAVTPSDRRIALFAHEGFGMAFLSILSGIPYPAFCTHFSLGYCGIAAVIFRGKDVVIPKLVQITQGIDL